MMAKGVGGISRPVGKNDCGKCREIFPPMRGNDIGRGAVVFPSFLLLAGWKNNGGRGRCISPTSGGKNDGGMRGGIFTTRW